MLEGNTWQKTALGIMYLCLAGFIIFGIPYMVHRSNQCESAGGVEIRTLGGIVCAKIDREVK